MQQSSGSSGGIPESGSPKSKSADLRIPLTYTRELQQKLEQSRETKEDDSCGDKEELEVRTLPSINRSANVGHLPNYYSRRLDGISSYHILSTNHLISIKGWGVEFFCHEFLSNRPPSNHSNFMNYEVNNV